MADKKTYQQLKSELDEVLSRLEAGELDIDEAVVLYQKGQKLTGELQKYLSGVKAKIDIIKSKK